LDTTSLLPVLGILALAVVVVILLLRFMRARHVAHDRRQAAAKAEVPVPAPLTKEEEDYLDSSHIGGPIVPGGRDALETWQSNKRK
jgi:hypothetical protein